MKKWFLSLVLVLAMALPAGAITGPPEQIYAFSPPPAQYVVIGDLLDVSCLIFESDLVTPTMVFSTHERDLPAFDITFLQSKPQWLVKGSKVKVYRVSQAQQETLSKALGIPIDPKPDFDMPDKIFVEFCLYIANTPKPKEEARIDFFKYSFFAGVIQGDRNEKGGAENYRFLGIGGALSQPYPLTFTAGGYVVDTITHHDIKACSEFSEKTCAKGWFQEIHQERSSCEGCSGLDLAVFDWVHHSKWGNWSNGSCPNPNGWPNGAIDCQDEKYSIDHWPYQAWHRRYLYDNKKWEQVGWRWPEIIVKNQTCTAYNGEIIGGYDTYTWKWVEVDDNNVQISTLLGCTYVTVSGLGIIFYQPVIGTDPLSLKWDQTTTKVWGEIRGVVPGEYTFTIPFLTKGRAPLKEVW